MNLTKAIKTIKGKRNWTVVKGDCLAAMRMLPDGCVDALVTDPPFGLGKVYDGKKEKSDTPKGYWKWLRPRYEEAYRLVKPGGFIAVWQTSKYFRYFWKWFGHDIHIYCAAKNFVQLRKKIPINYGFDPVVLLYKPGGDPLRPAKPVRNLDFSIADTASLVSDTSRIERGHPFPRPIGQVVEIVDNFVLPGGLVLDPFFGSGTTGVACLKTGRRVVGIELNPKFARICKRRMHIGRDLGLESSTGLRPLFGGAPLEGQG